MTAAVSLATNHSCHVNPLEFKMDNLHLISTVTVMAGLMSYGALGKNLCLGPCIGYIIYPDGHNTPDLKLIHQLVGLVGTLSP